MQFTGTPREWVWKAVAETPSIGPNNVLTTPTATMTKTRHAVAYDCEAVQLVFPGVARYGGPPIEGERSLANQYEVRCGLELLAGGGAVALFDGVRSGLVQAGTYRYSDVIPMRLREGDVLFSRVWANRKASVGFSGFNGLLAADGTELPGNCLPSSMAGMMATDQGEGYEESTSADTSALDKSTSGTIAGATGTSQYGLAPCAILGRLRDGSTRSIYVLGDSIVQGHDRHGYLNALGYGFVHRAFRGSRGIIMSGVAGEKAATMAAYATCNVRPLLFTHGDIAVVVAGRNDLLIAGDSTACMTALAKIFARLKTQGLTVVACTIPPSSTSVIGSGGDDFLTAENQTPALTADRTVVNDWLRGLPDNVDACADIGLACESALNSNRWKAAGAIVRTYTAHSQVTASLVKVNERTSDPTVLGESVGYMLHHVASGALRQIYYEFPHADTSHRIGFITTGVAVTVSPGDTLHVRLGSTYDGTHPGANLCADMAEVLAETIAAL